MHPFDEDIAATKRNHEVWAQMMAIAKKPLLQWETVGCDLD